MPPAMRTSPLLSSVAVGAWRPVFMLPVGVKVLVAGSYSSHWLSGCTGV